MNAASLPFATPDDIARVERRLDAMQGFMQEFIKSLDDQIGYKEALKITGIKSRTTLGGVNN